jgi:protein-disulfide isomerase
MKRVERQLGDKICFVFRNFPLTAVHPHAELAAEAAEAAGGQGKFWQMHDQIFEHQQALEFEDLVQYAAAIGLDTSRFIQDLTESRFMKRVREDFTSGARSGVNGTPTFFLNGRRYDGPADVSSLVSAIEAAASGDVAN